MKKLITGILATLACFACFSATACFSSDDGASTSNSSTVESSAIEGAKDYLKQMYKNKNKEVEQSYTLPNTLPVGDVTYTITWSVDATTCVSVVRNDSDTTIVVDRNGLTEDFTYTLTATLTDDEGNEAVLTLEDRVVLAPSVSIGTEAQVFYIRQLGLGKILYLDGGVDGRYLTMTDDASKSLTFYAENVNGSYKFYYTNEENVNMYLNVYMADVDGESKQHMNYVAEGACVFDYDAERNCWYTTVEDNVYVIGTYDSYATMSASESRHVTAENSGKSQFTAQLIAKDNIDDIPAIEVADPTDLSIADAITLGGEQGTSSYTVEKYYVTGQIVSIGNSSYGNFYIADADNNRILVYGSYSADGSTRFDKLENQPTVGDTVKLLSVVGNYNGTPQLKNAWILEITEGEAPAPVEPTEISIVNANTLGLEQGSGNYTIDKYYVTGTIVEIKNATYGNVYIADENGNQLYVYGLYSADGTVRYDAMETKPAVGDTVKLLAVIGTYNGTEAQMKNAWVITHTPGESTETPDPEITVLTIAEAIAKGNELENYGATTESFSVSGTVVNIANAQYGNIYIADENGNVIYVYGTDTTSLDTALAIGQNVTLVGVISKYNNAPQMKSTVAQSITASDTLADIYKVIVEGLALTTSSAIEADGAVNVAIAGATYTDVVISWTSNNACAVVDNTAGTVTYTLPEEATTVTLTATLTLGEATKDYTFNVSIVAAPKSGETTIKYTFADYTAGTQYAENEVHKLDDIITVTTNKAHFTSELRLYSSSTYDATAVISSTKVIKSLVLNAGNKTDTLMVYGSTDGETYTLIEEVSVSSSYADHNIIIENSTYTYIKLDVKGTNQLRIKYMSITMAD